MAAASGDAHPYPIYNARFRVVFPILDADGDLVTGASTPDSELSQDQGTFADATNEATEIATSSGMYYLDLIATELDTKSTAIIVKTATAGAKTTPMVLYPVRLPVIRTGTAQAGAATTITLDSGASAIDDFYNGCFVNITNDSPANARGQCRRIIDYVGSTKVATVEAAWGTNPSSASTFEILLSPEASSVVAWAGSPLVDPSTVGRPNVNLTHVNNSAINNLVSGRVDASVGAVANDAITAAAIATGAIDADAIADNAIDAGAIASNAITSAKIAADAIGASQIANGAIDAATFAAGAIDAAAIAIDAIGSAEFSQAAADKVWSSGTRTLTAFGFSVTVGTNNDKTGYSLSASGIQAIWDALTAALTTVGSVGKLLVDNVNATISSRATQTSVDTVDDFLDTEIAAIKAKTDQLTFTVANKVDATIQAAGDFAQAAADKVWSTAARTLTAFAFSVTVGTNNDKTGYALTAGERTSIAEALLKLDMSTITGEAARSVVNALRKLMNKWSIAGATLTVYKEDDATTAYTQAVGTSAGADPITSLDTN